MEPQGNLLADYYLLIRHGQAEAARLYEDQYRGKSGLLPLYATVFKNFIANPGDKANLP